MHSDASSVKVKHLNLHCSFTEVDGEAVDSVNVCVCVRPGSCDPRDLPVVRPKVWQHDADGARSLPGHGQQA